MCAFMLCEEVNNEDTVPSTYSVSWLYSDGLRMLSNENHGTPPVVGALTVVVMFEL